MTAQLSRERLEEKLLEHIKHGGDSEEETMIRMLLAGMDSKPVAKVETVGVCWYADNGVPRKPAVGAELYALPPSPVAVPNVPKLTCTCPSGDGSLRWPCPAHPPASIAADQTASKEKLLQLIERGIDLRHVDDEPAINSWVKCSERIPDAGSEQRVCAYTPSPHIDVRFRMVKASMFKQVCRDATHWQYMAAPEQEE